MKCRYCNSSGHESDEPSEYCIAYLKCIIDDLIEADINNNELARIHSNIDIMHKIQRRCILVAIDVLREGLNVHPEYEESFPSILKKLGR